MRLLGAELMRFRSRRAIVVLLLLGGLLALVVTAATLWQNRPIGAADLAEAQQRAETEQLRCEANPRRYGAGRNPDRCAQWFSDSSPYVDRYVEDFGSLSQIVPLTVMTTMAFVALLAGTTFLGADFASGSLSNTLLFRPNRWQVWLAKIGATTIWVAAVGAVVIAACLGALAVVGVTAEVNAATDQQLVTLAKRGVVVLAVVVAAGVLGAALTTALRSTIATAGLVIGYLLVGEALLRAVAENAVTPWLASTRVYAMVTSPLRIEVWDDGAGRPSVTRLYLWESAAYLGVIGAVLLVLCAVVFSRRDVA